MYNKKGNNIAVDPTFVGTQEKWANQRDSPICSTSLLDLLESGLRLKLVWLLHRVTASEHIIMEHIS
jgi:hypothetical protein